MNARIKVIFCVLTVAVLIAGIIIYNTFMQTNVKSFSLNNEPYYLYAMKEFPSDKYLGEIATAEEAKNHAVEEWRNLFGDKIYRKKPYKVFFDEETNVWLVKGSLPKGYKGGVPYILIQKADGKVLAIWHDQ